MAENNGLTPEENEETRATSLTGEGLAWLFGNDGHAQDCQKARECFEAAAAAGGVYACACLGGIYEEGLGVTQDYRKAAEWYEKAAIQGDAVAQCKLWEIFSEVFDDPRQALTWLEKAAEQGHPHANHVLAMTYEITYAQYGLPRDMKKARELHERAYEGWIKAAEEDENEHTLQQMDLLCQMWLACGGPKEWKRAAAWYKKAAERGNTYACSQLSEHYEATREYEKAREWYEKAAEQRDKNSRGACDRAP